MIPIACPECGKEQNVPERSVGKKVMCRACRKFVTVPGEPSPRPTGGQKQASKRPRAPRPRGGLPYRRHHYGFAHGLLPSMALEDPSMFLKLAADATGDALREAWRLTGRQVPHRERLDSDGLTSFCEEARNGGVLAVVELPPAEEVAEAYFVAGVYSRGERRGKQTELLFRLITLERTVDLGQGGGSPPTVLGEWAPDGKGLQHVNHGPGPRPERAAFVQAVRKLTGV